MTDKELVEGCMAYDRKYQEILYQKYASDMYKVCLMYSENRDDASDILQDSFIKVFKKITAFRFEGSLQGWIRRIVVFTAINAFNKKKKERQVVLNMTDLGYKVVKASINEIIGDLEARDLIAKVNQLPTKAKQVLKLYALEGHQVAVCGRDLSRLPENFSKDFPSIKSIRSEVIYSREDLISFGYINCIGFNTWKIF